ncbi:MAG: hypothetical protein IPL55_10515 [Saprospiraceae bacterium]|jgi:hypothetical protein|nr:hypothetical protein [Saprospiraceae bacterium]MBL0026532.1 hypothetical protein [Saprospiraceae bacterium]
MNTNLLLPDFYKKLGWLLFIPSFILGFFVLFFDLKFDWLGSEVFAIYSGSGIKILNEAEKGMFFTFISGNYTQTVVGVVCLLSLIMIAFSKEKTEDEFISRTRMDSLLWATYINYFILIFCFLFFFDFEFLYIMIFNMFTILIFFIFRFNYILYQDRKTINYEK